MPNYAENYKGAIEIAPLKGALGQFAITGEKITKDTMGFGIRVDLIKLEGESQKTLDSNLRVGVDWLWYPITRHLFFFTLGGLYDQAVIGRNRERDSVTWIRTQESERYDTWENHDKFVSATQTIGYRLNIKPLFTCSLRMVWDELIYQSSSNHPIDVYSRNVDMSSRGRLPIKRYILLYAGIGFF
jgi:hypothetical protein